MPAFIKPELASLVAKYPEKNKSIHKVKFYGYRLLAFFHEQKITLKSRNNKEWTADLHALMS
ncbi:MAG: hypothetical protein PSV35_08730 [bacterium]|nr:hypothetical protein [bacterium]